MTVSKGTALAALLSLATATGAIAQTTPAAATTTAPTSSAPASSTSDVVSLSEFQVSGASQNAYVASETMTGSRINTKIIDLPYSIVNLTSEFFNDFNIEVLDENMTYIGGLTGVGIGGGFNLRGFAATSMLRDGFYRLGRYGLSNIDRVEIIRGPNAAIYGRSSPGGMINFISLQPTKQIEQSFSFSEGSYDQGKANLKATGTIDQKGSTYYVLDVNQTSRAYPGQYAEIRNSEDFLAIEHDFSDNSHLKISGEYFLQIQHGIQNSAPLIQNARTATPDNTATSTVIGYDTALASFNPTGPAAELNRGSDTFEVSYDKEFNDIFSTRIGAYRFGARRWDFDSNTGFGTITIPAAAGAAVTSTRGSIPSRGEIMEDGGGFQADLVAHYFALQHKIDMKTLLTVDFNDYYRWDPTWETELSDPNVIAWGAAGSGRVVNLAPGMYNGRMDYIPTAPLTYYTAHVDPSTLALFNSDGSAVSGSSLTRRRTTSIGGNLRQQFSILDGRGLFYIGLRNDTVLFSERDYTVKFNSIGVPEGPGEGLAGEPGGSVLRRYEHQNKPNMGFNVQVLPNLHVYGSYSTAYFVDQTSRPAVIASPTYAPFTAKGYDYGIKGSYLDERLNFTLGGYYAKEFNVVTTDVVETSPGVYTDLAEQDGDQLVRGFEADLSYVILPDQSLTLGGSAGEVNSKYTYFGSQYTEVIGRTVSGVTPENGSVYLRYEPKTGPLQGFWFNALTTYVASTPSQAPNSGDTTTIENGVSVVTGHTDAYKVHLPSYEIWIFAAHYRLPKFNDHWDQEVSFTINNAFDKYYLKTNATRGDARGIMVQYTLSHSGY